MLGRVMLGRPREFDRDEALDAAMQLFWEQGYEATGIRDLTERLGIGRQSLYGTFGSKRELFVAAIDRYVRTRVQAVIAALDAPGSPRANIERVFAMWQANATAESTCGCLLANSTAELGLRDDEITELTRRKSARLESAFRRTLERAVAAGELSPDKQPRALARALVTAGHGLAVVAKSRPGAGYVREVIASLRTLLD